MKILENSLAKMTEKEMDKMIKKDNEKIKYIGESLDKLREG